jgi:hypothetical protein
VLDRTLHWNRTKSTPSISMLNRAAVLIAVAVVLAGCGDVLQPPSPLAGVNTSAGLLSDGTASVEESVASVGEILVAPLHRTAALPADVSWSFTVGPSGGTSSHAATGLTISVPRGALSSTVTITVTALAGTPVAYGFAPHGLVFAKKVQLSQSLSGLDVGLVSSLLFQGAHFAGDEPAYTDGLALVTETVSAHVNLLSRTVSFPIEHFSGWIVATGRSGGEESETQ